MTHKDTAYLDALLYEESGLQNDSHHCVQDVMGDNAL